MVKLIIQYVNLKIKKPVDYRVGMNILEVIVLHPMKRLILKLALVIMTIIMPVMIILNPVE